MKNALAEMKISAEKFNSRLDIAEEWVSALGGRSGRGMQTEAQRRSK